MNIVNSKCYQGFNKWPCVTLDNQILTSPMSIVLGGCSEDRAICIVGCGYHQWRSCELKVSHIYTDQEYRPCSVVVYLLPYTVYWAHTVYILTFLSLHSRADIIRFIHFGCVWLNWIELWCGMVWCGVVWCGVGIGEWVPVCVHTWVCLLSVNGSKWKMPDANGHPVLR